MSRNDRCSWPAARPAALLAGLLASALTLALCQAIPDYSGLTGPYCAARYNEKQCCEGRQDDCSVPIIGTLCYCDDFCMNRTRDEDCCPDYRSYCAPGNIVLPVSECIHNGKSYYPGNKIKINCKTCKCSLMEDKFEFLCEESRCLIEQEVIDRVNMDNSNWIARNYSAFWGRTLEEGLKLKLGTLDPSQSGYRMNCARRSSALSDLPREFDSRMEWPGQISPVQDQGWCGASWAISTVAVASDRFAIVSEGAENVQLSAQHLVSCNVRGQRACSGGHLDRAWLFVRKFGLADEECFPWRGKEEKCRIPRRKSKLSEAGCRPRQSYGLKNELFRVGPVYRLGTEADIMYEIMRAGPVQATMLVYQDFFTYESGIYQHLSISERRQSGYHSVRIIGWGEETSPYNGEIIKFWRVANSWGREWGEDGYFRIARGRDECEIERFVLAAWAKTA